MTSPDKKLTGLLIPAAQPVRGHLSLGKHQWDLCSHCGPMIRCGYCGNNCCNGGSGTVLGECPDKCDEAYALQKQDRPTVAVLEAWERWQRGGVTWEQIVKAIRPVARPRK